MDRNHFADRRCGPRWSHASALTSHWQRLHARRPWHCCGNERAESSHHAAYQRSVCACLRLFAVSYSFFGDRTPFLQHAAIAASMAALGPLDSVADVDMVAVAWDRFVPRPSAVSTALSTERCSRPRATVASQDLTVPPLEQTVAYAGEKSRAMFDICRRANTCVPSFICVDTRSCSI